VNAIGFKVLANNEVDHRTLSHSLADMLKHTHSFTHTNSSLFSCCWGVGFFASESY